MSEFTFGCYFPGAGEKPCFVPVKFPLDIWIAEALKVIYGELKELGRDAIRDDLRLYKVSFLFLWQTAG
jgi:hypothetical protein